MCFVWIVPEKQIKYAAGENIIMFIITYICQLTSLSHITPASGMM
jgi:hypothetical protein